MQNKRQGGLFMYIYDTFDEKDDGHFGAGYMDASAAFDSARSGMVLDGAYVPTPDVVVKEGTVIRLEHKGMVWKFDGKAGVSTSESPVPGTVQIEKIWQDRWSSNVNHISYMRPCLTLKGSCRITNIELDA